jgi:diguanylate cyclase (GGDEF)-like protein/PAS domain S-box-containing protein
VNRSDVLTARILSALAGGPLDVLQIIDTMAANLTPAFADGLVGFVPGLSKDTLSLVPTSRGPYHDSATLAGLERPVHELLRKRTQGLLTPPRLNEVVEFTAGLDWGSAVLAPLTVPGYAPGAVLYWRGPRRGHFCDSDVSILMATTCTCAPLVLAASLADHLIFGREVSEAIADAVIAIDPDFRVVRWNSAAHRLYGIPAEDAIGNSLASLYSTHYDDPDMTLDLAWDELQRTGRWTGQVTQQSKAGVTVSVVASVTAIRDDEGHLIGAVAVNRDNSEISLAKSRVRTAEGLLTDALDAAGAMAVVVDGDGVIVAANREWLDVALATGARMDLVSVGADYLRPVREAADSGDASAREVLVELQNVLSGKATNAKLGYRCDRPDGPHWYTMESRRLADSHGAVITHREVTQEYQLEQRLAHQSAHDPVTGLGNRGQLDERIRQADPGESGLIICDIDGFAAVNEAIGFRDGDQVLRAMADRLVQLCPPGGKVMRLASDQFAMFIEGAAHAMLTPLAERAREAARQPIDIGERQLTLSMSIGIATIDTSAESVTDLASELILRADAARIDSKARGRNRVRTYHLDLRDRTAALLQMQHEFSTDLDAGRLALHYQQILRFADDTVVGFEGLVRWPRDLGPVLTPATFEPILSAPVVAGPLARWSIDTALLAARALRVQQRFQNTSMGVNVSAQQFRDVDVEQHLLDAADRLALPHSAIVVEVTETTAFTDDERVRGQIRSLHHAGVHIALDDFGTGFSSLAHLRSLPADSVKLDKSFTAAIAHDPTARALVRSLIGLAHDLGLVVVAEGVEHHDQHEWLAENGCDLYQGFFAHRPAALDQCLAP